MTRSLFILAVCALLVSGPIAQAEDEDQPEPPTPQAQIASLAWLAGTWTGPLGPGSFEAVYTTASGGEVLSTNKEIRAGRVVSFEFERFFVDGDRVVMTPYVKGVKSVAFTLTTCDPEQRLAVFENPEHDFPQRISYHRKTDDQLVIQVVAKKGERWSGFELDLKRSE